jgi:glycosyltransferase involved in cell wall biosynthesis
VTSAVYLPAESAGIGGGENTVAVVAKVLEQYGPVKVISGKSDLNHETIRHHFDIELSNTQFDVRECGLYAGPRIPNPWERTRVRRAAERPLSDGFDIFVAVAHFSPPFCFAKLGIAHALYPMDTPRLPLRPAAAGSPIRTRLARHYYHAYFRHEAVQRLKSYSVLSANSDFTRGWVQHRWGGGDRWEVWHPPVTLIPASGESEVRAREILGVGRFVHEGYKMQREMAAWFGDLSRQVDDVRLTLAGNCSQRPGDSEYVDEICTSAAAANLNVRLLVNAPLSELHDAYRRARIFWHAMGYGVDDSHPENCEHFGMTTVEAMSAGCVPVVVDRGGQAEIVEHGISGFRWKTPGELLDYTRRLLGDDELWKRMSLAAQERAKSFSREQFERRLTTVIENWRG